jgi:hypothetical protein
VRYGAGVLADFYHGFHQAGRMDRQQTRIVFERGDLVLDGWVPTSGRLHALVDEAQTRLLQELFPGARIDVRANFGGDDRACRGRGQAIDAYQVVDMAIPAEREKLPLYGDLLRGFFADELAWIADRRHRRVVSEVNGRESLAMACAADAAARAAAH